MMYSGMTISSKGSSIVPRMKAKNAFLPAKLYFVETA